MQSAVAFRHLDLGPPFLKKGVCENSLIKTYNGSSPPPPHAEKKKPDTRRGREESQRRLNKRGFL